MVSEVGGRRGNGGFLLKAVGSAHHTIVENGGTNAH